MIVRRLGQLSDKDKTTFDERLQGERVRSSSRLSLVEIGPASKESGCQARTERWTRYSQRRHKTPVSGWNP